MTFDPASDETAFYRRRDELVTEFETWVQTSRTGIDPSSAAVDAATLFDWKFSYLDGDLSRWSIADLHEFLIEWCPRKVSGPADLLAGIPEHVGLVMEFLGSTGLLSRAGHSAPALSTYAVGLQQEFHAEMAAPANFGMAKSIFASLGAEDPTSLGPEELESLIAQFNDLPMDQRRTITDPAIQRMTQPPYLGTIQLPEPGELLASALAAPVLAAFDRLAEYFATARTLNKGGSITVADARGLAALLGTGEEPVVDDGHHSFRRRTAQNYPEVTRWVDWASQAGVLRKHRGKLVAVAKWSRGRRDDAIGTVLAAAAALLTTGPLTLSSRFYFRHDQLVDDHAFAILLHAARSGDQQFADVLAMVTDAAEDDGGEHYPGHLHGALHQLLARLSQAGMITQDGIEWEPGKYGWSERRATGTFAITPLGIVVVGQLADETGAELVQMPAPSRLTVDDLATLASNVDSSETWWRAVSRFFDALESPDRVTASVAGLVVRLSAVSPLMMSTITSTVPADQLERWEPGLRRLATATADVAATDATEIDETVRLLALHSLDLHGLVDEQDSPPDELLRAGLVAAGLVCADDGAAFVATIAAHEHAAETASDLIVDAARLLPPYAPDLLDAIGRHFPDKRIAKAARKELFRVRSKIAAAGQTH